MRRREIRKLKTWIFVYAALIVATVFMASTGSAALKDNANVSPVVIGEDAPALAVNALMRRSDI